MFGLTEVLYGGSGVFGSCIVMVWNRLGWFRARFKLYLWEFSKLVPFQPDFGRARLRGLNLVACLEHGTGTRENTQTHIYTTILLWDFQRNQSPSSQPEQTFQISDFLADFHCFSSKNMDFRAFWWVLRLWSRFRAHFRRFLMRFSVPNTLKSSSKFWKIRDLKRLYPPVHH